MHPTHIPLQSKSKSVILRRSCHLRPCCRFFCDHHNAFISSANYRIQMFKECNRLKILISAKFIRNPLSIFSSVVQIQHRCHCIYTKSIYMIMFNPEQCIRQKEVRNFRFFIIENLRSPIRMLALSRIWIFECRCSVKICQTMCIFREMRRYPVKNNTDIILMKVIHHICKIFRCSIACSWCIISGYLISPGTVKWMLCDSHQLNMSISHLFYILCNCFCKLTICIKSFIFSSRMSHPGTHMYFINRHWFFFVIPFLTSSHPLTV